MVVVDGQAGMFVAPDTGNRARSMPSAQHIAVKTTGRESNPCRTVLQTAAQPLDPWKPSRFLPIPQCPRERSNLCLRCFKPVLIRLSYRDRNLTKVSWDGLGPSSCGLERRCSSG